MEFVIKATQSLSADYKLKPNLRVENSLVGEVLKTRKPLIVYDVRKEQKYFYRDMAVKEGLTSMIAVPMIVKDKAIGVINVYTKTPHAFSQEEVNVLQIGCEPGRCCRREYQAYGRSFKGQRGLRDAQAY